MAAETMQAESTSLYQIDTCEWGRTTRVYNDGHIEIVKIEVASGWHSSIHLHRHKSNEFAVVAGELQVISQDEYGVWRRLLKVGSQSAFVPHNVKHAFFAVSNVIAWEFYRAMPGSRIDKNDIERFSNRGIGSIQSLIRQFSQIGN